MPFISSIRGSFGATGKAGRTGGPALILFNGVLYNMATESINLSTPNEYLISVVVPGRVRARAFGAGGGGAQRGGWSTGFPGGSGGYATGLVNLLGGNYKIIVGEGGSGNTFRATIGGGSTAQNATSGSDNRYSACGAGFSGIFSGTGTVHDSAGGASNSTYRTSGVQARSLLIAGGGGGGGTNSNSSSPQYNGGHGGGSEGTGGQGFGNGAVDNNSRGTQSSAGSLTGNQWGNHRAAEFMLGGNGGGDGYGGGGGGGYFGGSTADSSSHMGGGGGGSGFVHPTLVTSGSLISGSGQNSPGGSGQTGYVSGDGFGGGPSGNTNNSWSGSAGASGRFILGGLS